MTQTLDTSNNRAVLDLIGWDPAEKSILRLDNKWEFYWNKLLTPEDAKRSNLTPLLVTPSSWNDIQVEGKKTGGYGYATYRLTLVNLPNTDLMLDAYSLQTSSRIIINGIVAAEAGYSGPNKHSSCNLQERITVYILSVMER